MTQVIFLPAARRDMAGIFVYSNREFGGMQADRYISRIAASCEGVLSGTQLVRRERKLTGELSSHRIGSHRLYHRVDERGDLIVVRILHKSMSVEEHF